jgi:hypothetical protein
VQGKINALERDISRAVYGHVPPCDASTVSLPEAAQVPYTAVYVCPHTAIYVSS